MHGTIGSQLMRRETVEEIVSRRDSALALYAEAHEAIGAASGAIIRAVKAGPSPRINRYNHHLHGEKVTFHHALRYPERDEYMRTARRIVDTDAWAHLIEITDLERLMDKKAKDQLNQQLLSDPPEVTVDNVLATLQQLLLESGMIFRRGIAECFSALDRRFRSHDGWKIGSRIVLSYCFDEWGCWNYRSNHRDTMMDIERVFRILDDNPASSFEIVDATERSRLGGHGRRQSEIETGYFKIRGFKNGNAHIWFKRDDLLERVNMLLGEYYGAPIPEDREPEADTGLRDPKTTLARHFGFYPTPDAAAERFFDRVPLYREKGNPALTVLEPSAGTGNLARRCVRYGRDKNTAPVVVDCVEVQPALAQALRGEGIYRKVYGCDFLQIRPSTTGLFDRVVMNPPFDRERDIDHVMHALDFLKPDGHLCAIMSAGTEFRETRKSIAFRALMEKMNARWEDMPARSFSSVGTNCNTVILRVWKDARSFW